ncbi:hypothetical protein Hanom_Chr02g00144961 [Helianthus anomalus]
MVDVAAVKRIYTFLHNTCRVKVRFSILEDWICLFLLTIRVVWVNEEGGDWIPEFDPVIMTKDMLTPVNAPVTEEANEVVINDNVMPVNVPQPGITGNETPTVLERNGCTDFEGINCHSIPVNENNGVTDSFLERNNCADSFVPAVDFNFDQPTCDNIDDCNNSKVSKRKKGKKQDVGRPSNAYLSSNESHRIGKKPKQKDSDIFGLNSLLGISDSDTSAEDEPSSEGDESFYLNCNPSEAQAEEFDTVENVHLEQHHDDINVNVEAVGY